jgi:beta-glucosidase-like glycosyl hydrolase
VSLTVGVARPASRSYTAYSVETDRFGFIGNASTYDVYDSFLPQYAIAFRVGKAAGVMCSYMSLRISAADAPATQPPPAAHPSCASEFLLNHMVREQWGQEEALIVTDCEATASMYQHNHLAKDVADASAKSINAGVDLNTGYPFVRNLRPCLTVLAPRLCHFVEFAAVPARWLEQQSGCRDG